jgi:hypothetical protein
VEHDVFELDLALNRVLNTVGVVHVNDGLAVDDFEDKFGGNSAVNNCLRRALSHGEGEESRDDREEAGDGVTTGVDRIR